MKTYSGQSYATITPASKLETFGDIDTLLTGTQHKIGFIGLGKLGLPCAEVIAKKHDVTGYDIMQVDSDKHERKARDQAESLRKQTKDLEAELDQLRAEIIASATTYWPDADWSHCAYCSLE